MRFLILQLLFNGLANPKPFNLRGMPLMLDKLNDIGDLSLHAAAGCDEQFLQKVFRLSRPQFAVLPLPEALLDTFWQQQYCLQRNHYEQGFPGFFQGVVWRNETAIGQLIVWENTAQECLQLVDIGFLPEHCGQGYGRQILAFLQEQASLRHWSLQLSVDRLNTRAQKLYHRLGFCITRTSDTHSVLRWDAPIYMT